MTSKLLHIFIYIPKNETANLPTKSFIFNYGNVSWKMFVLEKKAQEEIKKKEQLCVI